MGALHAGHRSIVERARRENERLVVSLFVNPLQFGPDEDFQQYPRTPEADQALCASLGVDFLFMPSAAELGICNLGTQVVPPPAMAAVLCGPGRPGHFTGVATIVTQLLQIVQPQRAYFGQKDAQQVAIIRRVVADLRIPTQILTCPTWRESSGLAYSSRNQYLSPQAKQQAAILYQSLTAAAAVFTTGCRERLELLEVVRRELAKEPGVKLEYLDLVHPVTLTPLEVVAGQGLLALAAWVDSTRLIDNLLLSQRRPILAIDGPAGAGKSTVAQRVAQILGLLYLDSGAMYRAVTWLVLDAKVPVTDEAAVAELVGQAQLEMRTGPEGMQVWVNGTDVTMAIRDPQVTEQVPGIAAQAAVREYLLGHQQAYGAQGGIVMDGRDIGTQVFPDAEVKVFLTASNQERARRRYLDLQARGYTSPSREQLEQDIQERDLFDSTRALSPLRRAVDAVEIQTDNLTLEAVVERVVALYRERGGEPS